MIEIDGLVKDYGSLRAVDNIHFQVREGEILGFLGPNGAGKSTTLRVLTGYLSPTAGTIRVGDMDIRRHSRAIRQRLGYLPEHNPLYTDMTVYDFLFFCAEVRGIPLHRFRRELDRTVSSCGLTGVVHRKIGTLSKGYRQRVGFAQAILHDPQILVLDEPTSGLDPNQILEIRRLIRELGRDKTLILSSHIMQEVQAVCDRIVIIDRGCIAADGTTEDLLRQYEGVPVLELEFFADDPMLDAMCEAIEGISVRTAQQLPDGAWKLCLNIPGDDTQSSVYAWIRARGWVLREMYRRRVTLEGIFRRITMGEASGEASNAIEEASGETPDAAEEASDTAGGDS
ncbi:MAG: ATP-binding cassette domain-containing protein [Candidatus Cloacimonetes bacterium]|nr:ATP-binding cassette domain-containing protein [Candidatus Cloacimonadota bacterium]